MIKIKILFILLFSPLLLWGKMVETSSFSDIYQYIEDSETLIVSDLDNTIMESTRHLGSNQWGEYIIKKLLDDGDVNTYDEATIAAGPIWRKIQAYIDVRPVEPTIPTIIKDLQERGIVVLGLTSRLPGDASYTREQLQSIDVSFETPLISSEYYEWFIQDHAIYEQGILYCSFKNFKSDVLSHFFNTINHQPKRIIFIDDKWSHIKDLEKAFQGTEIEYIGVRYSGADERVNSFDPEIAEIQLNALPEILSDEEAARLKSPEIYN